MKRSNWASRHSVIVIFCLTFTAIDANVFDKEPTPTSDMGSAWLRMRARTRSLADTSKMIRARSDTSNNNRLLIFTPPWNKPETDEKEDFRVNLKDGFVSHKPLLVGQKRRIFNDERRRKEILRNKFDDKKGNFKENNNNEIKEERQRGVCYSEDLCDSGPNQSYPEGQIMSTLSRSGHRLAAQLVVDAADQGDVDHQTDQSISKRMDEAVTWSSNVAESRLQPSIAASHKDFAGQAGQVCPSEVVFAKPKRGKTAQGVWKDIVNVKDYTQTLRMEKCLGEGESCKYVSHHYNSRCSQVYNYHRLLSWSQERGLHMDIYKVPTCCSCQVTGYSYYYPPLDDKVKPATNGLGPGSEGFFPSFGQNDDDEIEEYFDDKDPLHNINEVITEHRDTFGAFRRDTNLINHNSRPKRRLGISSSRRRYNTPKRISARRAINKLRRGVLRRGEQEVSDASRSRRPSRINYNYHPIIDFFGGEKNTDST